MKNNKMLNDEVMHAFAAEIYDIANRRLNAKHSEKGAEITESLICKQFHNAYMSAKYNPDWEMNTNLLPPEEVLPYLVERYKQQESYIRPRGTAISDDETVHWLRDAENNIEWHYSDLYKKYLMETKKWGTNTVKSMSDDTDGILDLMADPRQTEPFDRRGLVIANVQSGKTANYIGLITKAADAGYHFIIVLAGIHNVLRSQTQQRIEEGFIGFDVDERSREKLPRSVWENLPAMIALPKLRLAGSEISTNLLKMCYRSKPAAKQRTDCTRCQKECHNS